MELLSNLKKGRCDKDFEHRQDKYLNNRIELNHNKLKRRINP